MTILLTAIVLPTTILYDDSSNGDLRYGWEVQDTKSNDLCSNIAQIYSNSSEVNH